ncbi:MAG: TetR/AcrR family transcriptional regulator [Myxococcota bacterium]
MPHGVAWAGDRPASPDDARERLLDAAVACIQRYGFEKTGISDVAGEAGVTRRTVYRYFADRDALLSAALVRGVSDFTARARALLETYDDPGEMVVEGVLFALVELGRDPLLGRVLASGALLTEDSLPAAHSVLAPTIKPVIDAAGWTPEQAEECGEVILRMAVSLLAAPSPGRSPDQMRGFLARRLLPALGL